MPWTSLRYQPGTCECRIEIFNNVHGLKVQGTIVYQRRDNHVRVNLRIGFGHVMFPDQRHDSADPATILPFACCGSTIIKVHLTATLQPFSPSAKRTRWAQARRLNGTGAALQVLTPSGSRDYLFLAYGIRCFFMYYLAYYIECNNFYTKWYIIMGGVNVDDHDFLTRKRRFGQPGSFLESGFCGDFPG